MRPIRFVTGNQYKIKEAEEILKWPIIPINLKIEELQTQDTENLVKDKTIKAFKKISCPLFVEHTGLYINSINGFPGGLTQIFWDTLKAEQFCKLFGNSDEVQVKAESIIGYCDGKKIYYFSGEIKGRIPPEPRGNIDFQWDCAFIPDGYDKTFAEMGQKKNDISMRKIALTKFSAFLNEGILRGL